MWMTALEVLAQIAVLLKFGMTVYDLTRRLSPRRRRDRRAKPCRPHRPEAADG
jgi:hypothetical protein